MNTITNQLDLSQLQESVTQVTFSRGNLTLWHDVFLERVSASNAEYVALVTRVAEADLQSLAASIVVETIEEPAFIDGELLRKVVESDTLERVPTAAEIEERRQNLETLLSQSQAAAEAARQTQLRARAERIAYLTQAWCMTENGQPLECTAANILRTYSPTLMRIALDAIEGAVFGFLGTAAVIGN